MDYFKKIERSVTISADKRSTVDLQVDVWSQDLNVTKFILKLDTTDSATIDLTNATVRVAMVYSQDGKDVKIEAAGIVEDVATQKIAYIMGDRLAGFEGQVTAGFYVTLNTGQRIDIQNVTFNMRKSLLDKDLEAATDNYYQTFDDIVADVESHAATQKSAMLAKTNEVKAYGDNQKTQIGQVLPSVQSKVSAINAELAKIDENMPDLFVAYADDLNGRGFSKTDSSKLYKGYGVKNSSNYTDYRWERNPDNIKIGGRNLLKDTANFGNYGKPNGSKDGWLYSYESTIEIEKYNGLTVRSLKNVTSSYSICDYYFTGFNLGDTYTLSFWAKGTVDNFRCYFYGDDGYVKAATLDSSNHFTSGYGDGVCLFTNNDISQSEWRRIWVTWKLNDTGDINIAKKMKIRTDITKTGDLYVCGLKLEKGTVTTDWSPAPEDQVSQVELNELKSYIGYTDTDIYGVEIDMTNRRFTRLAGAIGKNGGADFDNINAYKRRRCVLTNDGVVLAYHGESNYTESGVTTTEIVKNTVTYPVGTPVQVMVEQPKFYYKVVPLTVEQIANGKGYHMRKGRYYISDYPKEGFKVHPAFVRNGVVKEKIYLSAYEGSIFDTTASSYLLNDEQVADFSTDKLSSVANAKPCSGLTQNLTRANARLLAHNRGNGWEQQTIQTVSLTQLLFLIEYNMFNMQTAIGMGATQKTDDGSTNMAEKTGGTTSLGNASGTVTNTNGIQIVSYRGEENPFGNIWKLVDGINVMANGIHAAYVADHDFNDKQSTGSYTDVGFTLAKTTGYVSAFGYSQEFDWLFLTSETTGNSSVPVGDYFWQNYTATDDGGWRTVLLGANWNGGSVAGGFCWRVTAPSVYRGRDLLGRLVYVGG